MSRTIKKTYTITEIELEKLDKIKDRALDKKVILNDSEIVRFGINLVSKLSIESLIKLKNDK